jgi:hypothetical protein
MSPKKPLDASANGDAKFLAVLAVTLAEPVAAAMARFRGAFKDATTFLGVRVDVPASPTGMVYSRNVGNTVCAGVDSADCGE